MEIERKRIYLPLIISITLLLAGASLASASPDAQNSDKPDYVYLTWASNDTAHTINVSWKTGENYAGEVHYGTQSQGGDENAYPNLTEGSGGVTTSEIGGFFHHIELTGLQPDTKYYFVCGSPEYGWSEELSFETAPLKGESVTFVTGGDSRWDPRSGHPHPDWPQSRNKVTKVAASYNPDFINFTGDFLWSGDDLEEPDTWDNWFNAWYKYARGKENRLIPLVPTVGNHEITYPLPSDYDPEVDATNYYAIFNLPRNERWYSLDWGSNLHLIALDSEIGWTGSDTWAQQSSWLDNNLNQNQNKKWKFAAFHTPIYTGGEKSPQINTYEDWLLSFDTYHVDMAFAADDHGYERTGVINHTKHPENLLSSPENGTVYVVSAGWGAPLYSGNGGWWTAPDSPGRLGSEENFYHCTVIDIEKNTLNLKAVNHEGKVRDEYTIQKGPDKEPGTQIPVAEVVIGAIVILAIVVVIVVFYRK